MKIGIITFHWATNYGAILQAFALQSYLEDHGNHVEIINYQPANHDLKICHLVRNPRQLLHISRYFQKKKKESLLVPFREQHLYQTRRYYTQESLKEISAKYDVIISGSDQVLNPSFTLYGERKPTSAYYLSFASGNTKKIAYAVSFGCNKYPDKATEFAKEWIGNFDSIGVREKSGIAIVEQLGYEAPAVIVPDPVVLYGRKILKKIPLSKVEAEPYICVYSLRHELQLPKGFNYRIIDDIHRPVTLEEWISTITGADMLITNSFHGMVVALLNHIPFVVNIAGGRNSGMNDRFYTLLERLHLTSRISGDDNSLNELLHNHSIDWDFVDEILGQIATEGKDYLMKTLGEASI